MRQIAFTGIILTLLALTACGGGGGSGTLTGRVVDGFGNGLGGSAVRITLTGNPAVHNPDQWGNFIVHAPVGDYVMHVTFSNPEAGFNYRVDENVSVVKGTQNLGNFTLRSSLNEDAWSAYRDANYSQAILLFAEQALQARSGQLVFLPYYRVLEGELDENTLLTQGVLSAENGLGWCYTRGLGDVAIGGQHFNASLADGYNNLDSKVGLAGIAIGNGNAGEAFNLLTEVIDQPGMFDSSQVHDNIKEIDLQAAQAFAQFLMGQDGFSRDAVELIEEQVMNEGNAGSREIIILLNSFL